MNNAKKGIGLYLDLVAVVLGVVGVVATVVCSSMNSDYKLDNLPILIAEAVVAIVLVLAAIVNDKRGGKNLVSGLCVAVAVALLVYAGISLVSTRVLLASSLFSWNSANASGWAVFYASIVAAAAMIIGALVLVVGGFFRTFKEA